jgi:hypothetical protein
LSWSGGAGCRVASAVVAVQRCARRRERLEPAARNNVKCRLKAGVSC